MERQEEQEGKQEQALLGTLRSLVVERLDMTKELTDEELYASIDDVLMMQAYRRQFSVRLRMQFRQALYDSFRRLDVLSEALDDPEVTEIMVNGYDQIYVEKHGELMHFVKTFSSQEKLEDVIQQIVAKVNRRVNEANPMADARLEDGSRVNIILPPIALNGPILTIRRFAKHPPDMKQLLKWGALSEEVAQFLSKLVQARYNIFISGGTGSGKTTFLGALAQYIPEQERVVTIEDSAELRLYHIQNLVRLEARNASQEGKYEVTIRDLIRNSLRIRPDRIVVGEVRGAEALDMLQAMNTGHDGSLSTGHANSAQDMITRLETMVLMGVELPLAAIRGQIASAIDIIIHLGRLRDRSRKVLSIQEVTGLDDRGNVTLSVLYQFRETGVVDGRITGTLEAVNPLKKKEKLRAAGLIPASG
jgi:pilus assembly protein CpaF